MSKPIAYASIVVVLLVGCQRQLIPTPNLYVDMAEDPFADVPVELQGNVVDLLYLTDRVPETNRQGQLSGYGYGRSRSVGFGSCQVEIGRNTTWDELVAASRTHDRTVSLPLRIDTLSELGRFPETPSPLPDDNMVALNAYRDARASATDTLYAELARRFALTPRKEVYVYVHGFKNTIEDGAFRMAELWHFLGPEGVPIVYSWPAGYPGMLKGYLRDRESSEFTVFHLKDCIRLLAACPDVEQINLVSHSRGTDVLMTALRELIMVSTARGEDPRTTLKLGHIVIAAPDMDNEVVTQRIAAEEIFHGAENWTAYLNKNDRALGASELLFSNPQRLGKTRVSHYHDVEIQRAHAQRNVWMIDSRVKTDLAGHGYFLSNPATSSDLILSLRYERPVGAEHGRPLTRLIPTYYILDDNYPRQAAPLPQ